MLSVWARAPLRISFAGGGTDTDAFLKQTDTAGMVVSAAISRYVYARATLGGQGLVFYPLDEQAGYLERLINPYPPALVEVRVDMPPRSGLGTSGALGVAVLGCLESLHYGHGPGGHLIKLAKIAHEVECLEASAGWQDHVSAAFGGLRAITFVPEIHARPVKAHPGTLLALESSLILAFIHPRAGSSYRIMAAETGRVKMGDAVTMSYLIRQRDLAQQVAQALEAGNLVTFGELLDEAWQVKKGQSPEATNEVIDAVYEIAKKAGALGGKCCGAGGGGFMVFFAPEKEGPVSEALRAIGLRPENVTFDWQGLQVW
mgnify:CR=1 FL=1